MQQYSCRRSHLHRTQRKCKSTVTGRLRRQFFDRIRKRTFTQQCLCQCLDMDIQCFRRDRNRNARWRQRGFPGSQVEHTRRQLINFVFAAPVNVHHLALLLVKGGESLPRSFFYLPVLKGRQRCAIFHVDPTRRQRS